MTERGSIKGDPNRIFATYVALMGIYKKEKRQADIDKTREIYLHLSKCDSKTALNDVAVDAIAEASFFALEPKMKEYQEIKIAVGQRLPHQGLPYLGARCWMKGAG